MRVAIVTECFTPTWNGVTNSVIRVVDHLERRHHQVLVIAPGIGPARCGPSQATSVERVPALRLPAYKALPVGIPTPGVRRALEDFEPDVVHLAAPVVLGDAAGRSARDLGIPSVAVYQTDLVGFARRYGLGVTSAATWAWLRRVHGRAAVTLAPSSLAEWDLRRNGIDRVARWSRGVDLNRWNPQGTAIAVYAVGSSIREVTSWSATPGAWLPRSSSGTWPTWRACPAYGWWWWATDRLGNG